MRLVSDEMKKKHKNDLILKGLFTKEDIDDQPDAELFTLPAMPYAPSQS